MTAVSGDPYFDVIDDIVNKYSNTVHRIIDIKLIDIKSSSYAEYNVNFNEKYPKFNVGDRVRTSKYKNSFAKEYTQNWSEEVFVASKTKNTFPWTDLTSDLNGKKIDETFYGQELQQTNQKEFRIEKIIKRKDNVIFQRKVICKMEKM